MVFDTTPHLDFKLFLCKTFSECVWRLLPLAAEPTGPASAAAARDAIAPAAACSRQHDFRPTPRVRAFELALRKSSAPCRSQPRA